MITASCLWSSARAGVGNSAMQTATQMTIRAADIFNLSSNGKFSTARSGLLRNGESPVHYQNCQFCVYRIQTPKAALVITWATIGTQRLPERI